MKDYIKVKSVEEQEDTFEDGEFLDEEDEIVVEKKGNKVFGFVKRNWKKFAAGAAIAAGFVGGCIVGGKAEARKHLADNEDEYYLPDYGEDLYEEEGPSDDEIESSED